MRAELFKAVSCFTSWNWFSLSHMSVPNTRRNRSATASEAIKLIVCDENLRQDVLTTSEEMTIAVLNPMAITPKAMPSTTNAKRNLSITYLWWSSVSLLPMLWSNKSVEFDISNNADVNKVDWLAIPYKQQGRVLYRIYDSVSALSKIDNLQTPTRVHWRWKSIAISVGGATTDEREATRKTCRQFHWLCAFEPYWRIWNVIPHFSSVFQTVGLSIKRHVCNRSRQYNPLKHVLYKSRKRTEMMPSAVC